MEGRAEHKRKSEARMRKFLADKPDYLTSFYNRLFLSEQYLTAQNYTMTVARYFDYIKSDSISDFTGSNVIDFLLHLPGRAGSESSDSTKVTAWSALNKFGEYLFMEGRVDGNPLNRVQRPAMHDSPQQIYMTEEELIEIIEKIKSNSIGTAREKTRRKPWIERNLAIVELFLVTGMRVGALTEINLDNYDKVNKQIIIVEKRGEFVQYPLTSEIIDVLDAWIERREIILYGQKCDALFISNRRTRITAKGVADIVRAYTNVLDKHITPHKFRSTYATLVYQKTGDVRFVQECLHHKHIDTTMRYIKGLQSDTKKAAKIMTNVLH